MIYIWQSWTLWMTTYSFYKLDKIHSIVHIFFHSLFISKEKILCFSWCVSSVQALFFNWAKTLRSGSVNSTVEDAARPDWGSGEHDSSWQEGNTYLCRRIESAWRRIIHGASVGTERDGELSVEGSGTGRHELATMTAIRNRDLTSPWCACPYSRHTYICTCKHWLKQKKIEPNTAGQCKLVPTSVSEVDSSHAIDPQAHSISGGLI
jgi:hypothetical protein